MQISMRERKADEKKSKAQATRLAQQRKIDTMMSTLTDKKAARSGVGRTRFETSCKFISQCNAESTNH